MKEIKSVAILGAGALGLLYMDSIYKTLGDNSYFLTDDSRYTSLKNKTFKINSEDVQFPVRSIKNITEKVDLILVCVKNYHLDSLKDIITNAAGTDTIVISVLNGITSEAFLEKIVPQSTILYSAVLGMDAVKEDDSLQFTRRGKFLLGTKNSEVTPELSLVTDFFSKCEIEYIIPENIHREIWYKWMINIGVNQVSAVSGANYGVFQNSETLQVLMENSMREVISVAKKEQIKLSEEDIEKWYVVLKTLGPLGKTSMLQDIEGKRKTEVESFSGDLMKIANKHSIDVPVNETLYRLIKTKESLY